MPFLLFQGLGAPELLIILAIVVLLFGAAKIGDVGASMGRAIREFRRELKAPDEEEEKTAKAERTAPKVEPPQDHSTFQH